MSLFRRQADDPPAASTYRQPGATPSQSQGPRERAVTRIAEGTRITGEITGSTELLVDGEVEGEIRLDARAVVGPSGTVRGQVSARSVLVAGKLEGDVRGSERVEVGGSGNLQGNIAAPRVTIAEGAFFKGKVVMSAGAGRSAGRSGASEGGSDGGGPGVGRGSTPEGGAG